MTQLKDSKAQLYPVLPPGWIEDPDDPIPVDSDIDADDDVATSSETPHPQKKRKRRSTGAKTGGPTSHAASKKRRLADYWDLHHTTETMETLAKWSNYYASA